MTAPSLRVVILNHNAGELLDRCVQSAAVIRWSGRLEIVVIDNASADGSADRVEAKFATSTTPVRIVRRSTNNGFGANNEALGHLEHLDAVLLLNPDATIDPNAATLLFEALQSAPNIGAASPRIVFDQRFVEFGIEIDRGAARIMRVMANGRDITGQCHGDGGAWRMPRGDGAAWWHVPDCAILRVPADIGPVTVTIGAKSNQAVRIGDVEVDTDRSGRDITLHTNGPSIEVTQNAGSFVEANGTGHNRGFLQPSSRHVAPDRDTPGWCGAAAMLRPAYLRDVGGFAPEYFLYYEDTDLSWRGRSRGWHYRYVDAAKVRHRHSATTGQGSHQTDVLQQRNRLLLLLRNAPNRSFARATGEATAVAARMSLRSAIDRRRGGDADSTLARRRARGIVAVGSQLRWARRSRTSVRSRRRVPDGVVRQQLRGD